MADPTAGERKGAEPVLLIPLRDQERFTTPLPVQLTSFIGREREIEVLCLIPAGGTDTELAGNIFVIRQTMTTHIQSILNKLGVDNRACATYA